MKRDDPKFMFRMTPEVHDQLNRYSYLNKMSMNKIVFDAVVDKLDKQQKLDKLINLLDEQLKNEWMRDLEMCLAVVRTLLQNNHPGDVQSALDLIEEVLK